LPRRADDAADVGLGDCGGAAGHTRDMGRLVVIRKGLTSPAALQASAGGPKSEK